MTRYSEVARANINEQEHDATVTTGLSKECYHYMGGGGRRMKRKLPQSRPIRGLVFSNGRFQKISYHCPFLMGERKTMNGAFLSQLYLHQLRGIRRTYFVMMWVQQLLNSQHQQWRTFLCFHKLARNGMRLSTSFQTLQTQYGTRLHGDSMTAMMAGTSELWNLWILVVNMIQIQNGECCCT